MDLNTIQEAYQDLQKSYQVSRDTFLEGLSLSKEKEQLFEDMLDAYSKMHTYYLKNICL